jgi:hypothetical protein
VQDIQLAMATMCYGDVCAVCCHCCFQFLQGIISGLEREMQPPGLIIPIKGCIQVGSNRDRLVNVHSAWP